MMLTDLATALRGAGLRVVERPGWKTRGHGEMTDVLGVTCHHTASGRGTGTTLGLGTVEAGRPGLAGPLAHLYLNRDGTFYVVAAGLCWHAGDSVKPKYTNSHRIGIEALAAGDGWSQDWPPVQLAAYAAGCAALAEHYHFPVNEVRGHKETCDPPGRKIDPSFSMTAFRSMVESALATQRRGTVTPMAEPKIDFTKDIWTAPVTLTPTDAKIWTDYARATGDTKTTFKAGQVVTFSDMLRYPTLARRMATRIEDLADRLGKLEAIAGQQAQLITDLLTLLRAPGE